MPLYWMGLVKGQAVEGCDEPRSVASFDDGKERRVQCLYKGCRQTFRTMRFLKLHMGQHRQAKDKTPTEGEEFRYVGSPKKKKREDPSPTGAQYQAMTLLSAAWKMHTFPLHPFCYVCGMSVAGYYDDHVYSCKASMIRSLKRSFLPPDKYLPRPPSITMDDDLTAYNMAALTSSKKAHITCKKCNRKFTARIKEGCTHSEFHVHELQCKQNVVFDEELQRAQEHLKRRKDYIRKANAGTLHRSKESPKSTTRCNGSHTEREEINRTTSDEADDDEEEEEEDEYYDNELVLEEIHELEEEYDEDEDEEEIF